MTKTKRTIDNDDTRPPQPSPNPTAKKKNKEDPSDKSSRNGDEEDDEETKKADYQARNLSSRFDEEIEVETVSGTTQLWSQSILYPTPNWKQVTNEEGLVGFSSEELFGEGDTIHNLSRLGKIIRSLGARSSLTADGWSSLFNEAFNQTTLDEHKHLKKLKQFGIRLALSIPTVTFKERTAWIGSSLRAREDTNAWTGAYLFFGAPWNTQKIKHFQSLKHQHEHPIMEAEPTSGPVIAPLSVINEPEDPDLTQEEEESSKDATMEIDPILGSVVENPLSVIEETDGSEEELDSSDDGTPILATTDAGKTKPKAPKKTVAFKRNFYLSKPKVLPKAKPKGLPKALERKYNTFFKIRLPKMQAKDLGEQEAEVVETFQKLTALLWEIDSQILIYPWIDSAGSTKPLKKGGKLPTHRDGLKVYADNIYLAQYKSPWLKLRIGHTKNDEVFEDENFRASLIRNDMNFYKEKLQTKFTCRTGWLLGSHAVAFNARNLEAAIEQLSEFKNISIECRMEPIRTARASAQKKTSKPSLDEAAKPTRAAHIWTSWEQSSACRKALSDLYSNRNNEGFPLGIQARFVPYTMDSRFITTPKTAQNVERMKSKQKRFNDKTRTARNFTIIGLDYMSPDLGVTLREVIMGLRSSSQPERNLFVAVDQMSNYASVILAFHEDLEQEALTAIPALPIILQAKFGSHVWTWFNEDAKDYAAGYIWDKVRGLISTDDERTDAILAEWDSDDDDLDDEGIEDTEPLQRTEIATFDIVLATPGRNQYNDNYSVGTFKTACDPKSKLHNDTTTLDDGSAQSSSNFATSETSVISPSTSTLSTNESSREETFTNWCQDETFRHQAMDWLAKNLSTQTSLQDPPNDRTTAEDTNTGGAFDV